LIAGPSCSCVAAIGAWLTRRSPPPAAPLPRPRSYIQVADAIEEAFPNVVVDGNVDADGRPGSFEVVGAAGRVLFSRLASGGTPPQAAAIVAALAVDGAGAAGECSIGSEAPRA
jgi:hypothetical protein